MTTAALAKIKCPEALSWSTLAGVCRLCLRNECIKFDIFEDDDDTQSSISSLAVASNVTLRQRICLFYDIKVIQSEKLPTSICSDCLLQIEIHTEFRQCVLQNEQRLKDFALELFPKDDEAVNGTAVAVVGEESPEEAVFTEQEILSATVIDPNQVYVSSSEEEEDEDDDDEEEEGELTVVHNDAILLSDDDDEDEEEEEGEFTNPFPGGGGGSEGVNPNSKPPTEPSQHVHHHQMRLPTGTSILEQHLLQGQVQPHMLSSGGSGRPDEEQKTFFLCQFCDLGFKFQENCSEHEQTKHDAAQPYNCIFCLFCCDQRPLLQQHLRDAHGFPKPFICTECKKGFTRRSDLRKHTIVHTGVRPYTCHMCNKSFSRNTNLTKHMRIHSGHKPFVCPRCPRTFVTASDLDRHQRTHDGVKPFQCSICPSSFARRDKLINHQNMHIRRGHLAGTGVTGGGASNLTLDHTQLPPPSQAPSVITDLTTVSQPSSFLNTTSSSSSSGPSFVSPPPFSAPPNAGGINGSIESEGAGMVIDLDPLTEMRSANGMDMSQRILEAALMRGSLALPTPNHFGSLMNLPEQLFAPTQAEQQQQLQQEANIIPMEAAAEIEEAAIPLSPLPPPQMESVNLPLPPQPPPPSHQMVLPANNKHHTNSNSARPFVCPACGKGFPRKGELERHESVHTGARPYVCTVCEKRFSRKDKLVRHKRTHLIPAAGDSGLNNGQLQVQQQQQPPQASMDLSSSVPVLPQISFTAALENFRRTEMMNSRVLSMGGHNGGGGGGGAAAGPHSGQLGDPGGVVAGGGLAGGVGLPSDLMMMEPKDFSFKPNFYSQINIGSATDGLAGGVMSGMEDMSMTRTNNNNASIKEESF